MLEISILERIIILFDPETILLVLEDVCIIMTVLEDRMEPEDGVEPEDVTGLEVRTGPEDDIERNDMTDLECNMEPEDGAEPEDVTEFEDVTDVQDRMKSEDVTVPRNGQSLRMVKFLSILPCVLSQL